MLPKSFSARGINRFSGTLRAETVRLGRFSFRRGTDAASALLAMDSEADEAHVVSDTPKSTLPSRYMFALFSAAKVLSLVGQPSTRATPRNHCHGSLPFSLLMTSSTTAQSTVKLPSA